MPIIKFLEMSVRFTNLVYLLRDMEKKGWIIDSFPFSYNGIETIALITRYREGEKKPEHAQAKVCFVLRKNISVDLNAWANFFDVNFDSVSAFCDFGHILNRSQGRPLFEDFSKYFARFIPSSKVEIKQDELERKILGGRAEGNDPFAIYCHDVRRNGLKENGTPKHRSIENSNKAKILRPNLYSRFCSDSNLSFYFSRDISKEKTDEEIFSLFATR